MHITKKDIPVRLEAPGAVARQLPDFGEAEGTIGAEYFSLATGTDLRPLLAGLEDDACDSPHWGYLISGEVEVHYVDGTTERCIGGDVFHWPAGHTLSVVYDTEMVLFSPQASHGAVMDHIAGKLATV